MNEYIIREQSAGETTGRPRPRPIQPLRQRDRRQRQQRLGHPFEWLLVMLTLLILVGGIGMMVLLIGERHFDQRIYPHISVRGLDLGGYRRSGAQAALERRYARFQKNPVEIVYGEQRWRPSAEELGIYLDFDQAIQTAFTTGRIGNRIDNAQMALAIWEHGVEIPLRVQVDQTVMQHYLLKVAQRVETPPRDADVALHGPHIVVTSEQIGTQVLVDETLQDITAAIQALEPQSVVLRTRMLVPAVRDTDIAPVVAELHTLLDEPIILTGAAGQCVHTCAWEWLPEQIATWIHLDRTTDADGRTVITPLIDQAGLRNALIPMSEALREEGTLPRVNWNDGHLEIFQPGLPGRGLDAALALEAVNVALRGGPRTIELPMTAIPPPVTEANLASLGITDLVGAGVSSFRGSEGYRITNIRAGSNRMHGLLIPPDGVFSFNNNLGVVDASGGFVPGLAIVNNRTQREWGGGLCQVSTTMFRAAFWSGLPIIERHEHSFRIPWYEELGEPPGLDATIYTGAQDLQFINDTGGWLLVQAWPDLNRQRLTIALYGPPVHRSVTMSHAILERTPAPRTPVYLNDPSLPRGHVRQTDYALSGMKVEIYRVVRQGDVIVRQDTFPTTFKPWPNIYIRGTG